MGWGKLGTFLLLCYHSSPRLYTDIHSISDQLWMEMWISSQSGARFPTGMMKVSHPARQIKQEPHQSRQKMWWARLAGTNREGDIWSSHFSNEEAHPCIWSDILSSRAREGEQLTVNWPAEERCTPRFCCYKRQICVVSPCLLYFHIL